MAITTGGMLALTAELKALADKLPPVTGATKFMFKVDGHPLAVEYAPTLHVLRASLPALGVCVAVQAGDTGEAIKLLERALWKCEKRPGYVCLVDQSSSESQWVRAGEYEQMLRQRLANDEK